MSDIVEGGCFCGEIRYSIDGKPELQLFCYCSDCRRLSGTDGWAGYMVKDSSFSLSSGVPRVFDKTSREGRVVKQNFCGTCGTTLWGVTEFGLISIAAGTLDDSELFAPTKKVFVADAPHWARIPDELEEM